MDLSAFTQAYNQIMQQRSADASQAVASESRLQPIPPGLSSSSLASTVIQHGQHRYEVPTASMRQLGGLELCSIGAETRNLGSNHVSMRIDSGAGISVWPNNLINDGRPTEPTPQSIRGEGYALAGAGSAIIRDEGKKVFDLVDRNGVRTRIAPRICSVRNPLISVADLNDRGFDVVFPATSRNISAYAQHADGTKLIFDRSNQVYEYRVAVQPWTGNSRQARL